MVPPAAQDRLITYYAVWFVGIFVAADALGFEPSVVITGLGLTGLVLGFALKDVLSNFVAGLLLLFLRPFRIGDQIVVGETEGTVERIELRATKVRAYDGRLVLLPNAEVFSSRIVNNTADPIRRGTITTMLDHATALRVAATVFTEAAAATEGVLPVPPPSMRVTESERRWPGHRGPLLDRLKTQRLRGHDLSDTAGDGGCGPQCRHQIPDAADLRGARRRIGPSLGSR